MITSIIDHFNYAEIIPISIIAQKLFRFQLFSAVDGIDISKEKMEEPNQPDLANLEVPGPFRLSTSL